MRKWRCWRSLIVVLSLALLSLVTLSCTTPTPSEADVAARVAAGVAATQTADANLQNQVRATLTAVAAAAPTDTPVPPLPTAALPSATPVPPTPTDVPSPPTETPTSVPVVVATEPPPTAVPTTTPEPDTPTPLPPTATPLPTPEPDPSTPVPAARPAVLAYTVTETFRQHYRIEVINTDGTGQRVLSDMASEPSFSPDGQRVIFYSWPGGLETMKLDGSERQRIVHDSEAAFPNWSPNGKYIAFHSVRGWESRFNIYIANADGTEERQVVDGEQAAWSPDSNQLVYKGCDGSSCGLMMVNADGSGKRRLTTCDKCANDGNADWSRDNGLIVFTSERDGNHEIYLLNPTTGTQQRLTNHDGPDALPVWLPGGNHIAFRSFRDGQWSIYIMNSDGSGVRKLSGARVDPNRWIWEKMSAAAR